MAEDQEELSGGNVAQSVVRLGDTVRKRATKATPAVHSFLKHLRAAGFDGAPDAFGVDGQERQILEFVPGAIRRGGTSFDLADLRRVGALIRSLHEAAASFHPPASAKWDALSIPDGREILCHNDLAPWNLVCGPDRWCFIDWDNAAPGTRQWDLAWAAITFPPFEPACDLSVASAAMSAIVRGYGLAAPDYRLLIHCMIARSRAAYDLLVQGAKTDSQPWKRLHDQGHHLYWNAVSHLIDRHASDLLTMLAAAT